MICVMTLTQDRIDRMIGIRRHIHAHPELSFQENNTSDLVADTLLKAGYEVHRGLGGTGVVETLTGLVLMQCSAFTSVGSSPPNSRCSPCRSLVF